MSEHSLNLDIRKLFDLFDLGDTFLPVCKSDPAHSGIQTNMNMYISSLTLCFL